jgi:hypothetical protein
MGSLPENTGVYVCMIWFHVLLPLHVIELNISIVYFCFVIC